MLDNGVAPKRVAEYVGDTVDTILKHYTLRTEQVTENLGELLARAV
jgi:hypothetical protein